MKLLIFGDNHGDLLSLSVVQEKAKEADMVICLGDLTFFGNDLDILLDILNNFPKKVILMHGNHEDELELEEACKMYPNIHFSHKQVHHEKGFDIMIYGGDGFSRIDQEFEEHINEAKRLIRNFKRAILVLHGPPVDTKLDIPFEDFHSGNHSTRKFIEEHQPLLVLAGHIHECERAVDYIKDTLLFNPGPKGQLIDLEDVHYHRLNKKKIKKEYFNP